MSGGFLNWNFKLFRVAGIDVRIHWLLIAYGIYETLQWGRIGYAGYGAALMGTMFLIILLHEFGHCFMARALNVAADEILLWPLGGLAMMSRARAPRDQVWIAFAGPAVNLFIAGGLLTFLAITGENIHWRMLNPFDYWGGSYWLDIFRINYILLLFNLALPIYPLDGGQVFNGLLAMQFGEYRAIMVSTFIGVLGGAAMLGWGLYQDQRLLVFVGLWVIYESLQRRKMAQFMEVYDFAGEYSVPPSDEPRPRRPGLWARFWRRRQEKRQRRQEQQRRDFTSRVDEILDRVKQVGLGGLTDEERAILEEAAKRMRNPRE